MSHELMRCAAQCLPVKDVMSVTVRNERYGISLMLTTGMFGWRGRSAADTGFRV